MGSLKMNSQLAEDTDEECCDDPIKLFESDENAIYFGSKSNGQCRKDIDFDFQLQKLENDVFFQPSENSTFRKPTEQTSLNGSISECDFSQVCVKLVDCRKHPWYFRKYTEQILCKINFNLESDSDCEIDVVGIEDCGLEDCFIVEDLQTFSNLKEKSELNENEVNALQNKLKIRNNILKLLAKNEKMKRTKDDIEIKKALSQKNKIKVDLKRNQGLIGMKVKQKIEKNVALDVKTDTVHEVKNAKRKDILADEMYISAADKTLGYIGTQLIPISQQEQSNVDSYLVSDKIKNESTSSTNLPVAKIFEKPIDKNVKKKVTDKKYLNYLENTLNTKNQAEISSKIDMIEKPTNSNKYSSHVKDIKKTNKYKNDQLKNNNKVDPNSLVGVMISNTKDFKYIKHNEVKDVKQSKVSMKPKKKVEKQKRESHSPILPCSSVPKKPKMKHDKLPKCNKSDANIKKSKETDNLNQIVNKITNLNYSKTIQSCYPSKNITKIVIGAKSCNDDSQTKPVFQKHACFLQNKVVNQVSDTREQTFEVPEKHVQNCTDINKSNFKTKLSHHIQLTPSSRNNKTPIEKHLTPATCQDNLNKHSFNIVSIKSPCPSEPTKNSKPKIGNKEVPTKTVITSMSEPKNATISNKYANSTNGNITPVSEPRNATISNQHANSINSNVTLMSEPKNATISNQRVNSTNSNITLLSEPKYATISNQNANSTNSNVTPVSAPRNATISNQHVNSTNSNITPMSEPKNATISNQFANSTSSNITPMSQAKNATISNQRVNSTNSNIALMSEPKYAIISNQNANSTKSNITPLSEARNATIANQRVNSTNSNIAPMSELKYAIIYNQHADSTNSNIIPLSEPKYATISNQYVNSTNSNITPMNEPRNANISNQHVHSTNNNVTSMIEPKNATSSNQNANSINSNITPMNEPRNENISNKHVNSTNSNVTSISEPKNATISNQHADSTNSNSFRHQFPIQSIVAGTKCQNNFPNSNNINVPVHKPKNATSSNQYANSINSNITPMNEPRNANISNKHVNSTNSNVTSMSEPKNATISNQHADSTNSNSIRHQFPIQSIVAGTKCQNNFPSNNNINVPVHNRYASAIILKANHFQVEDNQPQYPAQTRDPQRNSDMHIPSLLSLHSQPRFRSHQNIYPGPGFYQSAPSSIFQKIFPNSVGSAVPNRFTPLQDNLSQQLNNPTQSLYRGRLPRNLAHPPSLQDNIGQQLNYPTQSLNRGWMPRHFAHQPSLQDNIGQQLNNTTQSLNRGWLPRNIAHPTPPPPPSPPPFNPQASIYNDNQTTCYSYSNPPLYPLVPGSQQPQSTFSQNLVNAADFENSSIIGRNNGGLVKKINIVAVPVDGRESMLSEDVKDPQILISHVKPEVVATKTEMLEELDKSSLVDENINDLKRLHDERKLHDTKKGTFVVEILSEKPKTFESFTVNPKNYVTQIEQQKRCSPVLPKPNQKILDRVITESQTQVDKPKNTIRTEEPKSSFKNEMSDKKRDFGKCFKGNLNVNQMNYVSQIEQPKGCPQVLPKSNQKILDRVVTESQTRTDKPKKKIRTEEPKSNFKNEIKPVTKKDFRKSCKRDLTINQKKHANEIVKPKGYSPPILPIPTYQKIFDRVVTDSKTKNDKSKNTVHTEVPKSNFRNEIKPKREFGKSCKKKPNMFYKPDSSERKDDAKKISLEEYKKRLHRFKYDDTNERSKKKMCKEKYNRDGKRLNIGYKYRENVDHGMEIDLGYDSDSTVVL